MIGVVGDRADAVCSAADAVGTASQAGTPGEILAADPDAVVAVGEAGLIDLVRDRTPPDVPVLVVDAVEGFPTTESVADAVDDLGSGAYDTVDHPVLGVAVGGDPPSTGSSRGTNSGRCAPTGS